MSNWNKVAQDKYINNLAQNAIGKLKISQEEFEKNCGTSFDFATHIFPRVFSWVRQEFKNSGTLAKIIECQIMGFTVDDGQHSNRFTSVKNLIDPNERLVDNCGVPGMRRMASLTICGAIYDTFLLRGEVDRSLQAAPDESDSEDNFFIAQDNYDRNRILYGR